MKKRHIYRSSITGEIVTKEFALSNPDTTQKETLLNPIEELLNFARWIQSEERSINYTPEEWVELYLSR